MGLKPKSRYADLEQIINGFQGNADILAWAACCLWGAMLKVRALEVLGQAVDLRPNAPELLWQRASYLCKVGNDRKAIEDLMHLLDVMDGLDLPGPDDDDEVLFEHSSRFDLPEAFQGESIEWLDLDDYSVPLSALAGINRYVVSALLQLRELSPEKYEEAKQKPCITSLSPQARSILFADVEAKREPPAPTLPNPRDLILAKRWRAVVDLLQPRVEQPPDTWPLEDTLHLFMAYWALGDDEKMRSCGEQAKARFRELWRTPGRPGVGMSEIHMMALVFWKTGERDKGDEILTRIDWTRRPPKGNPIFSYWRYEKISWDLNKADCHDQRQMFRDAKVLPPVLE